MTAERKPSEIADELRARCNPNDGWTAEEIAFHEQCADAIDKLVAALRSAAPPRGDLMADGAFPWLSTLADARAALAAAPADAQPDDPMDWPLPCDVTVGHVTMRKGVALRTLVLRMQTLFDMVHSPAAREGVPRAIAWCDDAAMNGGVGNCASNAAREHWLQGHWVEQEQAKRLKHPLYAAPSQPREGSRG